MMREICRPILLAADLGVTYACVVASYRLRYSPGLFPQTGPKPGFEEYEGMLLLALALWIPIFVAFRLDRFPAGGNVPSIFLKALRAIVTFMMLLLAVSYLQKSYYSRLLLLLLSLLLLLGLVLVRLAGGAVLEGMRRRGIGVRRAVIVGSPAVASKILKHLERQNDLFYNIAGLLSPADSAEEDDTHWDSVFCGHTSEVPELLLAAGAQEVIFALPLHGNSELLELIARCQQRGLTVRLLPDFHEIYRFVELMEIGGMPFLEVRDLPRHEQFKRPFDLIVGAGLLVVLSPLLAGLALLLLALNGGGILHRQRRTGQFGRPFLLYRFQDPGAAVNAAALKRKLSAFLHNYRVLELPQLFNVLRGEMSLIGPRAERRERARFSSEWNKKRLAVKPGITGWAQVRGLGGPNPSEEETRYALEYTAKGSWATDVFLLLRTAAAVLGRAHADQQGSGPRAGAAGGDESSQKEAVLGGRPC